MKTDISVIIPTFNNYTFLEQCVESLAKFSPGDQVVIVDNGSTDETKDYLDNHFPTNLDGILVTNKENKGFGIASNQGAKNASGEYLIFLNNDTLVTSGWSENMRKVFDEEKNVGAVGAKLIHPGKGTVQHAGVERWGDGRPNHLGFGKDRNHPAVNKRADCFAVTGACLMIKKEQFFALDGFDEAYWCGWEDVDLCNRLKQAGMRVIYEPTAEVYHYESRTEGRYSQESHNFNLYMKRWVFNGI